MVKSVTSQPLLSPDEQYLQDERRREELRMVYPELAFDPNEVEPMPLPPGVQINPIPLPADGAKPKLMPMPLVPEKEVPSVNLPMPLVPKPSLGASSTETKNIAPPSTGALGNLGLTGPELKALGGQSNITSAIKIAQALAPKKDPVNPWMAALLYFTEMGRLASKPGATALGAAAGAGTPAVAYLMKKQEQERKRKASILPTAVSLPSNKKPKTGVPKSVMMGPVIDDKGDPVLDQTTGKQLYQYNTYDAAGNVIGKFNAPMKGGGVNVKVGGPQKDEESAFAKKTGGDAAEQFGLLMEASRGAGSKLANLRQLSSLLRDPNFQTGKFQDFMLPFRQWARSLGVDSKKVDSRIDDMEKQVVGVDGVVNAELFRAKASQLVLDSVAQMKGALSDKELDFLASINPSLANTKESNQILVLLAQQQMEKISGYQDFAIKWQEENGPLRNQLSFNKMNKAFRERPESFVKENPYEYVLRKGAEYEKDLLDEEERITGIKLPRESDGTLVDVKPGAVDPHAKIRAKVTTKITSAFPIRTIQSIFKGSPFYKK